MIHLPDFLEGAVDRYVHSAPNSRRKPPAIRVFGGAE